MHHRFQECAANQHKTCEAQKVSSNLYKEELNDVDRSSAVSETRRVTAGSTAFLMLSPALQLQLRGPEKKP